MHVVEDVIGVDPQLGDVVVDHCHTLVLLVQHCDCEQLRLKKLLKKSLTKIIYSSVVPLSNVWCQRPPWVCWSERTRGERGRWTQRGEPRRNGWYWPLCTWVLDSAAFGFWLLDLIDRRCWIFNIERNNPRGLFDIINHAVHEKKRFVLLKMSLNTKFQIKVDTFL